MVDSVQFRISEPTFSAWERHRQKLVTGIASELSKLPASTAIFDTVRNVITTCDDESKRTIAAANAIFRFHRLITLTAIGGDLEQYSPSIVSAIVVVVRNVPHIQESNLAAGTGPS